MRTVELMLAGTDEPIEVSMERARAGNGSWVVSLGDHRVDATLDWRDEHAGQLRLGAGRVLPVRVVRRDSTLAIWLDGRTWIVEVVDRTARRRSGAAAAAGSFQELAAPMPGKVLKINARPGEAFEPHDAIILIESMKMEMSISVPVSVRVSEILCAEDELVEMGQILARLEPVDTGDDEA